MDWKAIMDFCLEHIEYSALLSAPLIFWFMAKNKHIKGSNDVTKLIIQYKKLNDSVNQRSKGMMNK